MRRGRPPRDREGEDRRADYALSLYLRRTGGKPWRELTEEQKAELRVRLGDTPEAVDEVLSLP